MTMSESEVKRVRKRRVKTVRLKHVSPEILEDGERPLLEVRKR